MFLFLFLVNWSESSFIVMYDVLSCVAEKACNWRSAK